MRDSGKGTWKSIEGPVKVGDNKFVLDLIHAGMWFFSF